MTTGVLMYCFDTEYVQYHRSANYSIQLIKKNLGLPVTVISDAATKDKIMNADNIIEIQPRQGNVRLYKTDKMPWQNMDRSSAFELSPYDNTILLDCDYFVYTDNLLELTKTKYDFFLYDQAHDISSSEDLTFKSESTIPMVWATVVIFKKNESIKRIFDMIKYVQTYYRYFYNLYRVEHRNFRNDYAFAIALNQLCIDNKNYRIPGKIATLALNSRVVDVLDNGIVYKYNNSVNMITDQDVHVLDKELNNYV